MISIANWLELSFCLFLTFDNLGSDTYNINSITDQDRHSKELFRIDLDIVWGSLKFDLQLSLFLSLLKLSKSTSQNSSKSDSKRNQKNDFGNNSKRRKYFSNNETKQKNRVVVTERFVTKLSRKISTKKTADLSRKKKIRSWMMQTLLLY